MTKQDQLLHWLNHKKIFATHDVISWGCQNYYNRADRTKRDFLEAGLIRKLPDWEKRLKNYACKDDVYEVNQREMDNYLSPKFSFAKTLRPVY